MPILRSSPSCRGESKHWCKCARKSVPWKKSANTTTRGAITLMTGTQSNRFVAENLGGLQKWIAENAKDNEESMQRLRRALTQAVQNELTPKQRTYLQMYYFDRKNMTEIAEEEGVDKSTVSRTIARAENNLYRVLRYCV